MKATEPLTDESSVLTQVLQEVLGWFFSNKGKHRDLLLQNPLADAFAIDADQNLNKQQLLTIQPVETYQYRHNPSITLRVGSTQNIKPGLGISVEHSAASIYKGCLQKRTFAKYNVTLLVETSSKQTTTRLAKMLSDIFFQYIPEYYQNVVMNDQAQSQIIFPQEYTQSPDLIRDFQADSNVERIYGYKFEFEADFESIHFVKGYDKISIVNQQGRKVLSHDLPASVRMGEQYVITVKTNLLGVRLYSQQPGIFELQQISGPQGEGDGDRIYRGHALRVGKFVLRLQDLAMLNILDSKHSVNF
jgi:hypothetical protein